MSNEADFFFWKRGVFPKDSLGRIIMPDSLEGRTRPNYYMLESAIRFVGHQGQRYQKALDRPLRTFLDLLNEDKKFIKSLFPRGPHNLDRMIGNIDSYFGEIALGSEGMLMRALYGQNAKLLIPPEDEVKRREILLDLISKLSNPKAAQILDLNFGLHALKIELRKIAKDMFLTEERTRITKNKTLTQIRWLNSDSHVLDPFLLTPTRSRLR